MGHLVWSRLAFQNLWSIFPSQFLLKWVSSQNEVLNGDFIAFCFDLPRWISYLSIYFNFAFVFWCLIYNIENIAKIEDNKRFKLKKKLPGLPNYQVWFITLCIIGFIGWMLPIYYVMLYWVAKNGLHVGESQIA